MAAATSWPCLVPQVPAGPDHVWSPGHQHSKKRTVFKENLLSKESIALTLRTSTRSAPWCCVRSWSPAAQSLERSLRAEQHLCDVQGQNAQDLLRPQVPDGCAHGRRSSALVGRRRPSFVALRLSLSCLRAQRAHTLDQRLCNLGASAVQALKQGTTDCRELPRAIQRQMQEPTSLRQSLLRGGIHSSTDQSQDPHHSFDRFVPSWKACDPPVDPSGVELHPPDRALDQA